MFANSWKRWLAAGIVAIAGFAQAAPVEVVVDGTGSFQAGDTLVVRLKSDNPRSWCSAAFDPDLFCAADLRLGFNSTLINDPVFIDLHPSLSDGAFPPFIGPIAGAGNLVFMDVSFLLYKLDTSLDSVPDLPTEIMSFQFTVQAGSGGQGNITVELSTIKDGDPFAEYVRTEAASPAFDVAATNTVPEPASLALMAMGLGIGGWANRRRAAPATA